MREWSTPARTIALVMSLAILHPSGALAQINVTSAGLAGGGTVTGPILFPSGTAAAPSVSFSAAPTNGLYYNPTNNLRLSIAGVDSVNFTTSQLGMTGATTLGWYAGAVSGSIDTILTREAAATVQLGVDLNGASIAQSIKACDGITGTDIAGCNFIVAAGRGTGAGAPGILTFQTSSALGSGTTGQTLATRMALTGPSLGIERTVTAGGTTGAQTINKMAGTVNFAIAASAIVVTNVLVDTNSIIFAQSRTADATCTFVKSVVPASGSFTITMNANCTAETSVGFWVTN